MLFCRTTAQVAFTFGDKVFQMKPKDLAFVPLNVNNLAGTCRSSISSGTIDNQNSWLSKLLLVGVLTLAELSLVGDAFLKSNYFASVWFIYLSLALLMLKQNER